MKKKTNFANIKIYIFSILFLFLLLAELQIIIRYPQQFLWSAAAGCLILIDGFLLLSSIMKQREEQLEKEQEQFANVDKSQKASYLLLKKCFLDLDERMSRLENIILSITNVIEINERKTEKAITQAMDEEKKVAKIVIGRSRENTEALMNSNDELQEKVKEFEAKLTGMEERLKEAGEGILSLQTAPDIGSGSLNSQQYQEIFTAITELREGLNGRRTEAEGVLPIEEEPEASGHVTEEPEPETEVLEESEAEIGEWKDFELEVEKTQEPGSEAEAEELEPGADPEIALEQPVPDMSDPNKIMTPDEIAALLANVGAEAEELVDDLEQEPIAESEAFIEGEPVAEEIIEDKPFMPDMSDPNKIMTPDEIAALIANL